MSKLKIILGTVQFGLNYGINNYNGKPEQNQVNEILLTAMQAGIQCLDTAEAYGNAHQIIGDFHKKNLSAKFEVISKLPHKLDKDFETKVETYLKDLDVPCLKGLLFHSFETYKECKGSIGLLGEFKKSGKVKYIGVSIYSNSHLEELIQDTEIDIIQLPFNMLDNVSIKGGLLQKAKEAGKIIHTRSAFLQGLFFKAIEDPNKIVRSLEPSLRRIQEISRFYNIPIRQMALNYCLDQKNIDEVLIGVDNLEQLKQNLNDVDLVMPTDLIEELNKIKVMDTNLLNPALWN
ncbi:MAG: aldo/keto reductase [Pedobacter sp.]|uniref:aldo/keto reductase n=1 Tax=Pedobacter sp. TaxID=1411316 RepID=UPI00280697E2|nr:aldo/keto reductase [Pedobacter sp.]MDQ8004326.1 aldo/keto reductase [Pedobacter sp.]